MTLTVGKAFCYLVIGVLTTVAVVSVFYSFNGKDETQNKLINSQVGGNDGGVHSGKGKLILSENSIVERTSSNPEASTSIIAHVDAKGNNIHFLIEDSCLTSTTSDCKTILDSYRNQKIQEWINENEFNQCAIVRLAENNCILEKSGLNCDKDLCLAHDQLEKNASKAAFWYHDCFEVTQENI